MGIRSLRNKIGKKIKFLRINKDLSQEKLSEHINLSREHISCLENGKYSAAVETLYNLACFFEVDIKYFFE